MKRSVSALVAGILFGFGLSVAQMVSPAKVLGFLDLAGNWDPSLALVMVGALLVSFAGYRFVRLRAAPLFESKFHLPTRTDIDRPLIGGAVLFGIGWGLVGLCPGPALAALAVGDPKIIGFVVAMVVGMALDRVYTRGTWFARPQAA
ncbi:MAG: YeeE/YedE family protein [Alphaproteobacteria bacterium]|nr:YeeE/YedE family protein [Alphaproteobacteria bacterium]